MDHGWIEAAAEQLVRARRGGPRVEALTRPPASLAEAHAIQDAVTAKLGEAVGAYKANVPKGEEPTRGIIYAHTIKPSPATLTTTEAGDRGVEGEVAFRFTRALPKRASRYTREEVADAMEACAAIEVVSSRYAERTKRSALEMVADSIANQAFVPAETKRDWRGLDLGKLHVTLKVNGEAVVDQEGGHPTGDPLGVAVALVNMVGVTAGQYVTCGSFTGLRFLNPGDRCTVTFAGLGEASVKFG